MGLLLVGVAVVLLVAFESWIAVERQSEKRRESIGPVETESEAEIRYAENG
jgi:hypothetical protein